MKIRWNGIWRGWNESGRDEGIPDVPRVGGGFMNTLGGASNGPAEPGIRLHLKSARNIYGRLWVFSKLTYFYQLWPDRTSMVSFGHVADSEKLQNTSALTFGYNQSLPVIAGNCCQEPAGTSSVTRQKKLEGRVGVIICVFGLWSCQFPWYPMLRVSVGYCTYRGGPFPWLRTLWRYSWWWANPTRRENASNPIQHLFSE